VAAQFSGAGQEALWVYEGGAVADGQLDVVFVGEDAAELAFFFLGAQSVEGATVFRHAHRLRHGLADQLIQPGDDRVLLWAVHRNIGLL